MSLVGMVVVGVALVLVTASAMRGQAVRDGTGMASRIAVYAAGAVPATAFVTGALSPEEQTRLVTAVRAYEDEMVALRLWSADGRLLHSLGDAATTAGPHAERLARALSTGATDATLQPGAPTARAGTGTRAVLEVYVPVLLEDTARPDAADGVDAERPVGAAEVVLDHSEAQDSLGDATRAVTLVVAGSLVLLWLLLFRIVHSTSRRLRNAALENARLAMLDALTGLPNRRLLADEAQRAIDRAVADGSRVGLVLLDVDRFKDINDTLGHDRGDELLQQVAERLRAPLHGDDLVARLGGDEFAILLPDVRSVAHAERLARRVRALFDAPFELSDIALHVETSIGVACLPDHAADASSLMRTADIAMYAAKHRRTGVSVYSPDTDDSSPARLVLLGELHRALEARTAPGATSQLEMYYQPKIDLASQRIVGLEALMRWCHPTRGLLLPGTFVPLAEQSGLIHRLTAFALEESVRQLAAWAAQGRRVPVAVNLSAHDVASPAVVELIEALLAEHHVEASMLEVEITETALVTDPSRVVPVLERLGRLGVGVAIDDFGRGTTSISQLRDLPVAELKIDRMFVADLGEGGRAGSEVVVKAMVDLAHSFGLRVVAEGVEDRTTARALARLDVDRAQGFLWSRAVPASEIQLTVGQVLHPIG